MTSERITLMMDSDITKKVRAIQSTMTKNGTYSFSRAVNDLLREALK